jgi:hypothetical protein
LPFLRKKDEEAVEHPADLDAMSIVEYIDKREYETEHENKRQDVVEQENSSRQGGQQINGHVIFHGVEFVERDPALRLQAANVHIVFIASFSTQSFHRSKKVHDVKKCAFLNHIGSGPFSHHRKCSEI